MSERLDPFEALDNYAWHRPYCPAYTKRTDEPPLVAEAVMNRVREDRGAHGADLVKPRGRCTCGFRKILDYYRTNA